MLPFTICELAHIGSLPASLDYTKAELGILTLENLQPGGPKSGSGSGGSSETLEAKLHYLVLYARKVPADFPFQCAKKRPLTNVYSR